MNPIRIQLTTALPLAPADDPDVALAALLAVEARIVADMRYGSGTTIQIQAVRITKELTSADQTPPKLMYVETEWEVTAVRELAVAAPSLAAGRT